jgi:hypothetical protein
MVKTAALMYIHGRASGGLWARKSAFAKEIVTTFEAVTRAKTGPRKARTFLSDERMRTSLVSDIDPD